MMTDGRLADIRQQFEEEVLQTIRVQNPETGEKLSYHDYLDLDKDHRSGDERAFVDDVFTKRLLEWLGYDSSDWIYDNRPKTQSGNRPDFQVKPNRALAFVVEDKNSTEEYTSDHKEQLQRYTAGTQGYALWTNARTILALRFYPGGREPDILARVRVDDRQPSFIEDDETSLALFRTLFEKRRFVEMPGILDRICIDPKAWKSGARPLDSPESHRAFITETRDILDMLALAARAQIEQAERDIQEGRKDLQELRDKLHEEHADKLLATVSDLPTKTRKEIEAAVTDLFQDPHNIDDTDIRELKPDTTGTQAGRQWDRRADELRSTLADFREREAQRRRSRHIHNSYEVWRERYRIIEGEEMTEVRRQNAFAEQVAYTFFIRLLLARILEDKGAINRRISDGGLKKWRKFVEPTVAAGNEPEVSLYGQALLDVLFRTVSRFYQHFFDQRVFDWFTPDDYLLAQTLERISTFSFAAIDRDILGYTYEAYVERAFRTEKGHFLTRGEIVDYILDEAGFEGREIIGRKVLDPAAGSGSFLVHAARRIRRELEQAINKEESSPEVKRRKLAEKFVDYIQSDLVGLEINPFSCYLAELNLFLQCLDDILYLWKEEGRVRPIEQFQIFNTDSLVLPENVLQVEATLDEPGVTLGQDQARHIKIGEKRGFDYVVMNPPYINRGKQEGIRDLTSIPFYKVLFGGGDVNYFHAFIRLANYYVREGGTVALICPLQLYGDRSSGGIRRWLSSSVTGSPPDDLGAEWNVTSLTRFYDRTVLFEDVTQAVCVSVWRRERNEGSGGSLKVAGGWDISNARSNYATHDPDRILASDPVTDGKRQEEGGEGKEGSKRGNIVREWYNAWPVVVDDRYLDAWERLRESAATDVANWVAGTSGKPMVFHQGDVNMTRTKPLRAKADGGEVEGRLRAPVPTAGSKDTLPFGPYRVSGALDAKADVRSMDISDAKKKKAERERKERVLRLYDLNETEAVCVVKAISGIEYARPIQGALYHRGGDKENICFEHSTQIIYPKSAGDSIFVEALFGLLVSSAANFIYSIFGTGQNVSTYEIRRLIIPKLERTMVGNIAALGRKVQKSGAEHWSMKDRFGCGRSIMDVRPDPWLVLSEGGVETETLETARLRGHLKKSGPDWHVSTLWDKNHIRPTVKPDSQKYYEEALGILLPSLKKRFGECKDLEVPVPSAGEEYVMQIQSVSQDLVSKRADLFEALANLDRYVLSLYGITDLETCRIIGAGMPWASTQKEWVREIVSRLEDAPTSMS